MRIRALVFDFDGLILDTESSELQGWAEVYREHGVDLPTDLWATMVGRPYADFDPAQHLEGLTGRTLDRAAVRARKRDKCKGLNAKLDPRPGVAACLAAARQLHLKVGIASSSDRAWVTGHLQRLGLLEYFATLTCFEDTADHKPLPAPYLKAIETLGVKAHEAVALEDSANGIAAAKAAGLFCIAIPNPVTAQLDLAQADLLLRSLADLPLPELLRKLESPPKNAH